MRPIKEYASGHTYIYRDQQAGNGPKKSHSNSNDRLLQCQQHGQNVR